MKYLFWTSFVLVAITLGASGLFWSVFMGTGEMVARKRAVGYFRWAVVIVLATFNIWIFTRVGGAIKDMWFPAPPAPAAPAEVLED
jgi:hypothetical protein